MVIKIDFSLVCDGGAGFGSGGYNDVGIWPIM